MSPDTREGHTRGDVSLETRATFIASHPPVPRPLPGALCSLGLVPESRLADLTAYRAHPPDIGPREPQMEHAPRQLRVLISPIHLPNASSLHFGECQFSSYSAQKSRSHPDFTHMPRLTSNPRANPVGCAFAASESDPRSLRHLALTWTRAIGCERTNPAPPASSRMQRPRRPD